MVLVKRIFKRPLTDPLADTAQFKSSSSLGASPIIRIFGWVGVAGRMATTVWVAVSESGQNDEVGRKARRASGVSNFWARVMACWIGSVEGEEGRGERGWAGLVGEEESVRFCFKAFSEIEVQQDLKFRSLVVNLWYVVNSR
ncbi:hypothetical protein [Entomobacter blattae]|uniref:Uncharacterized protein n=1 Tax=Entomobacter blattae TaxID=2762277 RepID=A0A7H1NRH1_9PROT|nr:hypothetical protein [Entomobacter blattae]QNT78381.1 hypothetical protein JGUZn3_11540 [Entomobacter blattae]